ncbi:MAG: DUF420 domain-containing protein [bacterium]|jgi:uncharacterized membrane protein YozB (DUF420 family)
MKMVDLIHSAVPNLPHLNAALNATSTIALVAGWIAIRRGRRRAHRACMLTAAAVSVLFLVSYLVYHVQVGSVPYQGQGWARTLYFAILASHAVLAALVLPLVLVTLRRALRRQYDRHRTVARWALPVWLYVSVTGVAVYVLLYRLG